MKTKITTDIKILFDIVWLDCCKSDCCTAQLTENSLSECTNECKEIGEKIHPRTIGDCYLLREKKNKKKQVIYGDYLSRGQRIIGENMWQLYVKHWWDLWCSLTQKALFLSAWEVNTVKWPDVLQGKHTVFVQWMKMKSLCWNAYETATDGTRHKIYAWWKKEKKKTLKTQ